MIYLIIPCFNEEKRLNLKEFSKFKEIFFVFANDGSTDSTSQILKEFTARNENSLLFDSKINYGKANIIYNAYQFLQNKRQLDQSDWIGYWDADLATPIGEVFEMLKYSEYYDSPQAVWGSRVLRLGSEIQRAPLRHYLGRVFATLVSLFLHVKSYDSQCGAKIFKKDTADMAFKSPFITKWIFDVEIFLRLKGVLIIEYPLRFWRDVEGSKVNIKKDALKVIKDIWALRRQYINND